MLVWTSLFLFPWDFYGALDWRTGIISEPASIIEIEKEIEGFKKILKSNISCRKIFFLPTPLPPITYSDEELEKLRLKNQSCRNRNWSCDVARTLLFNENF